MAARAHRLVRQVAPLSPRGPFVASVFRRNASVARPPTLREDTLNPRLVKADYAVRGEVVIKADELVKRMEAKDPSIKFKELIPCNIGNPHDVGQKPLTFPRQVLALCHYPALMTCPIAGPTFPEDVKARAQKYLKAARGGTGAYTASQGLRVVREEVAQFIQERDGFPSNPDDIFLTDGASSAVKMILTAIIRDEKDGVMVPVPQYPLYSATLTLQGGSFVGYELDERNNWSLQVSELSRALAEARAKGINVRALVVINPGNPTGQCLPADNIKEVLRFCHREGLVVLADEVYQANIYAQTPFTSFKKVLCQLQQAGECLGQELVSFHSVSKGFLGECGQRGGYMELFGFDPAVRAQLYKMASISLCSNTSGQIMVGLMVNPPRPGEPSYPLYAQERQAQLESLRRRAQKVAKAFNEIPGVKCNPVEGAMYAFPQIVLPPKAIEAAKKAGKAPDTFYALQLLEATGIVVVPGSGFGQHEGTYHFRTTILPLEDKIDAMIAQFKQFHEQFLKQYS